VLRGGRADVPWHRLRGAEALMRVCAESGADAILCGHIHDRYDEAARPGRPRVICAGSSTELGREGAWMLDIEARRIARATLR
jgi:Icc-related predicted phosphoesterase